MFHSLKTKFILAFGMLIAVLFASLGLFLIDAKTKEFTSNIAQNGQAFAQFTSDQVMQLYREHLVPGNFIQFNRQIQAILQQANEVENLTLVDYSGVILYDYLSEQQERYSGEKRRVDDELLPRVQSVHSSLLLGDGQVLYLQADMNNEFSYVDVNENPVDPLKDSDLLEDIILPIDHAYALIYDITYSSMEESLRAATVQIALIALVGLLLSLMLSFILSVSITRPLKDLKQGALRLASGDFGARVKVRTQDEVGVLADTFNRMAAELSSSIESKIYKERVAKELELAAGIQIDLLPKETLELPGLTVTGGLIPATEIGGDAFDFIAMENGATLIYIGDGTGHGVPAGIMSLISNALLYALRDETKLMTIAENMNTVIQKKSSNIMFITMALTLWEPKNGVLHYLNAGHLPLLHFEAHTKKLSEHKLPGIAFGMLDDIRPHLHETELHLKRGDIVVLYSDGVPDAQNEKKEPYGVQRLKAILEETAREDLCAEAIKEAILADVMQFIGKREHIDDITVVVIKKK